MIDEKTAAQLVDYLNQLSADSEIKSLDDIYYLPTRELLLILQKVDKNLLPLLVQILKASPFNQFEKLMGDHDPDNKTLVDDFFNRYMSATLTEGWQPKNFNPLLFYLPEESLSDLAFVQSRQAFFERQTMYTIREYLESLFGEGIPQFKEEDQNKAWNFFWKKLINL